MLKDYLEEKSISLYAVSKKTKISYSTLNYIANNKTDIKKTSLENALKIAQCLNISIEELCSVCSRYSAQDFENFKSTICHEVKDKGSVNFIRDIITSTRIEEKWEKCRKQESLYLLSMIDYLSRLAGIPQCTKYDEIRKHKMDPVIYPLSYIMAGSKIKIDPIPEFEIHGIIEGDIFDVS